MFPAIHFKILFEKSILNHPRHSGKRSAIWRRAHPESPMAIRDAGQASMTKKKELFKRVLTLRNLRYVGSLFLFSKNPQLLALGSQ